MSDPATNISPSSTHHVKQLLASYARNAPLSLTGPGSALEEQSRLSSKYKFKLNDDVSLSKVYPGDSSPSPRPNGSSRPESGGGGGGVYEQLNKQIMLQRERIMRQYQEQFLQAEKERERGRERQLSGRSRQNSGQERQGASQGGGSHLSGEQIRKLRENQKQQERQRAEEERRLREGRGEAKEQSRGKSAFKSPAGVPNACIPIMSSSDTSWSELEETSLDGEQISCFNVGGEFRLCLPQILNSVLEKVSLQAINQACDELQIYCSTCSKEQLQVLKDAKILPVAAHQCGLITKSDAERLCSYLLDKNPPRASVFDPKSSPFSFKVQHDCFGRCEGLVLPEAYTTPNARCIECLQCEGLFSAQKFVCHAHDNIENRTCHWGFDSNNWRTYIKLSEDYTEEEKERHAKVMEDFKNRYNTSSNAKRRQDDDHYDKRDVPSNSKRAKTDSSPLSTTPDPYAAMALYYSKLNAFRPWSPKGGFPGLPPYPLHSPYSRGALSDPGHESSSERFPPESPHSREKRKYQFDKEDTRPDTRPDARLDSRFPSLAEEISTVAEALSGAPVHAKETVLKILERLTQRLDRAERDRDLALGRYRELQARYEQLEEELSKKRGELRELLRQDSRAYSASKSVEADREKPLNGRLADTNGSSPPASAGQPGPLSVIVEATEDRRAQAEPPLSKPEQQPALVKVDPKSPVKSVEQTPSPEAEEGLSAAKENISSLDEAILDRSNKIEQELNKKLKDSDFLQERMIKMEAELTALKEELSTRSKPSADSSPDHSQSNGSEGGPGCNNSGGVIRKTENIIKDESAEEKN